MVQNPPSCLIWDCISSICRCSSAFSSADYSNNFNYNDCNTFYIFLSHKKNTNIYDTRTYFNFTPLAIIIMFKMRKFIVHIIWAWFPGLLLRIFLQTNLWVKINVYQLLRTRFISNIEANNKYKSIYTSAIDSFFACSCSWRNFDWSQYFPVSLIDFCIELAHRCRYKTILCLSALAAETIRSNSSALASARALSATSFVFVCKSWNMRKKFQHQWICCERKREREAGVLPQKTCAFYHFHGKQSVPGFRYRVQVCLEVWWSALGHPICYARWTMTQEEINKWKGNSTHFVYISFVQSAKYLFDGLTFDCWMKVFQFWFVEKRFDFSW